MADKRFSDLPSATALADADLLALSQSGTSKQLSGSLLKSYAQTGVVLKDATTGSAYLPTGTTAQRTASPTAGLVRYNSTTQKFEGYGSAWGNLGGGAAIGDTAPANPGTGDLWWNSATGHTFVFYGSAWVDLFGGAEGQYLPLTGGTISGNLAYTGTLTGGTGVINIGSGQFYKDAAGNVGIGTTSPSQKLSLGGNMAFHQSSNITTTTGYLNIQPASTLILDTGDTIQFRTSFTERARITSGGVFLVRSTSALDASSIVEFADGCASYLPNSQSFTSANAGACVFKVGRMTTSRSINASGTINASGADYAEYMTKSGDFEIAKGDVCGIDENGLLTNVFAEVVSFVVKSTDPSYVGNDSWGAGIEDPEVLEVERQKVDRIAFAGQVPVNVFGANAGDYIVPVPDEDGIKGEAVTSPTFEQYQKAVGKVIAIEPDGRARILVKVA